MTVSTSCWWQNPILRDRNKGRLWPGDSGGSPVLNVVSSVRRGCRKTLNGDKIEKKKTICEWDLMGPSSRCCLNTQNKATHISYVFAGCLPRLRDIRMEMCREHKAASAGRARLAVGGWGLRDPKVGKICTSGESVCLGGGCGRLNGSQNANAPPDQPRVSYLHLKLLAADFPGRRFCPGMLEAEPGACKWHSCALAMCLYRLAGTQPGLLTQEVCRLSHTNLCHPYSQTRGSLCIYFSLELNYETQVNILKCHFLIPHIKGKLFLTWFPVKWTPLMLHAPSFHL